jgi:hypothetical protein
LALTLLEKRRSKSKEKVGGSVYLNWHDLSPWRGVERTVTVAKGLSVDLLLQFAPMQVAHMTPESTKLPEMRLSFERTHFWPGEVVRGILTLNVSQPRLIHGLQLAFDGFNYVDWYDEFADRSFTGHDVYFSKKQMLLGQLPPPTKRASRKASKNGEHHIYMDEQFNRVGLLSERRGEIQLEQGVMHFPFAFSLPMGIPHSMSHMDGCVGIFYFVTGRIFESSMPMNTVCREEIQIAPPRVSITHDPSVSHTESETKIISKHAPLCDNFSHALTDEPTLEELPSSFSETSMWSRSPSSFDRLSYLEESHLKSFSFSDDVDLDGDDAKWLTRKNSDLWAIKAFQITSQESHDPPSSARSTSSFTSDGPESDEASSKHIPERSSKNGQKSQHSFASMNRGTNVFGLPLDDEMFGVDEEDEMLSPRSQSSDSSETDGIVYNETRSRSSSRSNSRPAPVAVNAILPPLAAIGKPLVFQVTIENRSNKPINSVRASLRSVLYLSGYTGGRQYKRLREWWSPKGTVIKTVVNAKSHPKDFPIQPGTSWRGDVTLQVPANLYPSIQVRHLHLSYELKLEAKSSSKLLIGSFEWKQAVQVVQNHADKEVQLITPPTEPTGDPCQLIIGNSHAKDLTKAVIPLPLSPEGCLPITGYKIPSAAFK